jgi:hypothetical protein
MMDQPNPVFNNQVSVNQNTAYFATIHLKKSIVKQLQGKTEQEQEAIIEQLLKFLDINLLAALSMAYEVAEKE